MRIRSSRYAHERAMSRVWLYALGVTMRCLTTRCPPQAERAARCAADSVSPVQCLLLVRTGVAGLQLSSTVRCRRKTFNRCPCLR